MPFAIDAVPLMKSNRSVRMRYCWGRANWLNDKAQTNLDKFLSRKRFRIGYEPAGGQGKLKYAKPDDNAYRSVYKPVVSDLSKRLSNNGKCDIHPLSPGRG